MSNVEKAIEALRAAVAAELETAYAKGAADAKREAITSMAAALGIEQPKKRGRKPKA